MPKLIPPVVELDALARSRQPVLIVDDEFRLRPWLRDDAPSVRRAFSLLDIQHWHFRRFDSLDEAETWIAESDASWATGKGASWAITRRANDAVVGRVALYLELEDGHGEISYWVLPEARDQGVATRSVIAATSWAHALGLHRVELQHSTSNHASGRVAIKAGFVSEGVRRGANLHDDGWHDMHLYSHLASD